MKLMFDGGFVNDAAVRYKAPASRPRILIILHQEASSAGRVGQWLEQAGFSLDIRRPVLGQQLPETLEHHAGAIIFGGPMSANDSVDFIRAETDWINIPLRENKPFLGICLGAQMLANQIGGYVTADKHANTEIGWYPLKATAAGEALMSWPQMVYHFHVEGFWLPKDAVVLASGETYPNQAYRYGENAWGVQFHAELTQAMMQRWVVYGAGRFQMRGAQNALQHLNGRLVYDATLRLWLGNFLERIFGKALIET